MEETKAADKAAEYNEEHISPTTIAKTVNEVLAATAVADVKATAMHAANGHGCRRSPKV